MADTSMIERELVVPDIESGGSAFSWSAAIAGAFAATAVTFVIVALGSWHDNVERASAVDRRGVASSCTRSWAVRTTTTAAMRSVGQHW
jgi:hypothetical protein